ncbi:serine-type exopeptidase activity [Nesidiocoris tenuis]|uniref:Prolyl endopeptidase n=1 Tax=Nesidiocoris tenuis TaxID=355587 RepID=A0ABN7AS02_9HEMI|nr:serine-type exopeptidase activity [Nesidiocoris tenuis]
MLMLDVLLRLTVNSSVRRCLLHSSKTRAALLQTLNRFPLSTMKFEYPVCRRDETVKSTHFSVEIADPYRWLEDPDSEETKKFVEEQNKISIPFLHDCENRDKINRRLTEMWDFPKYGCPFKRGDRYFFYMNTGLQNQSVLYKQDNLESEPTVFLDPNILSEDGTIALSSVSFSEDGKTMGYALSVKGSDWTTFYFKDVETGKDYPEKLEKTKHTYLSWTHDNKGVFYGYFPEWDANKAVGSETGAVKDQKLYYHRLGTPQSEDVLCVEFADHPDYIIGGEVSDCGRWLISEVRNACHDNLLYFADLQALPNGITGKIAMTEVISKFEADYLYITNTGTKFVFRTNKDTPNYKLVVIDFENFARENWTTLVPEHPTDVLDWAACVAGDKLVLCYTHDVKNILHVHSLVDGSFIQELPIPMGTICSFKGKKEQNEIFFDFTSFFTPGTIFRCDLSKTPLPLPTVFKQTTIADLNADDYEAEQVFYQSKDGTKVPMFIMYQKGMKMDGNNGCLLYGYGGFNYGLQPVYSTLRMFLMKHFKMVLAVANLRGGGEYGQKWHDGGRLLNKQNTFDDLISAAEFLIAKKYTRKELLSVQGGSNGGLVVAASINQRPDLFGAGIVQVGVLDCLRYHKFTCGAMWTTDYGNPDEEVHFRNILKYSPLHNIRIPDDQYPALLLTTADHDDRVVPSHSLKFIAQLHHILRDHKKQTNPLIIRVETEAGHGAGKPTAKKIEECTDIICFLSKVLGVRFVD